MLFVTSSLVAKCKQFKPPQKNKQSLNINFIGGLKMEASVP